MTAKIVSIQIGKVVTAGDPTTTEATSRQWTSAFGKRPVDRPVEVIATQIVGDEFGNPAIHGGVDKAVLCYADSNYARWRIELPQFEWSPGAMGENLTIAGLDETTVCIGDSFAVGEATFQVSQPRQPCWKINRFHGDAGVLKKVAGSGRIGWYLRVLRCGGIAAGQSITLLARPHPAWTIARAWEVFTNRNGNQEKRDELFALEQLSEAFR